MSSSISSDELYIDQLSITIFFPYPSQVPEQVYEGLKEIWLVFLK